MLHAVLNEDNLAVLLFVLRYLPLRAVDVGKPVGDVVVAVAFKVAVGGRLKEAIDGKEVREVFLCNLAHFADELQAGVVGVQTVRHYLVLAEGFEEFGIEGSVLLCLMVVEVEGVEHADVAIVRSAPIEWLMAYELLHGGAQGMPH